MRRLPLCLLLLPGLSLAETGYVYSGDLNGDGVADSLQSGPAGQFGNGGGPFLLSLSDGRGGFHRTVVELHHQAVALERTPGRPRLWSYLRSSCCAGTLVATRLDETFETRSLDLAFGQDPGSPSLGRDVYDGIFNDAHRIAFQRVPDYQPPAPPGGEWGK